MFTTHFLFRYISEQSYEIAKSPKPPNLNIYYILKSYSWRFKIDDVNAYVAFIIYYSSTFIICPNSRLTGTSSFTLVVWRKSFVCYKMHLLITPSAQRDRNAAADDELTQWWTSHIVLCMTLFQQHVQLTELQSSVTAHRDWTHFRCNSQTLAAFCRLNKILAFYNGFIVRKKETLWLSTGKLAGGVVSEHYG